MSVRRWDPAALDAEWPFELNATPVSFDQGTRR
jgi:hypothetical protein